MACFVKRAEEESKKKKEVKKVSNRIFVYDGREFPDPDPNLKVDEVRQSMANFFPELSNAETKESKRPSLTTSGETDNVFEFKKRVGVKGKFRMPGGFTQAFKCHSQGISPDVDTTPMCKLGYCAKKNSHFQGGDATVTEKYKNGICPICGGPTDRKYWRG